jgi:hypothetical protein
MGEDGVAMPLLDRLGEGVAELGRQRRVVGKFRAFDRRLKPHLRRRQQHRELRPGQAQILLRAAEQFLVAVEALDGAVEAAALLQDFDDPDQLRQGARAAALGDRQRQRLQAVVLEHQSGDVVGHLGEQRVALLEAEPSLRHLAVQRDLDVDLVVRAIDAGTVVDEVGVDPPALPAELDPRRLGDAEIGALADRLDAKIGGVDADGVVAGVADFLLAFASRFHIGADAAEP